MTEAEKEAKRKLKEKMAKKIAEEKAAGTFGEGADEDEKAYRDKIQAEAKRRGALSATEEGREQLDAEEAAKEEKRRKLQEDTDPSDPYGRARAAREAMQRQANDPFLKAVKAIGDVGKSGIKELLKVIPGVSSEQAGKLTDGIEHVVTKGNLDHPGVQAATDIAVEQAKKAAKDAFDQGVENRRKLMEEKKPAEPVVGSPAMPAQVNVRIEGPVTGTAVPAAAAAAGEVVAQSVAGQQAARAPAPTAAAASEDPQPMQGGAKRKRPRRGSSSYNYMNNANSVIGYVTKHLAGPKNPKLGIDPSYFC
jgi:hypothetical protein